MATSSTLLNAIASHRPAEYASNREASIVSHAREECVVVLVGVEGIADVAVGVCCCEEGGGEEGEGEGEVEDSRIIDTLSLV